MVVTVGGRIAAKGYQEFAQHFPRPGWVEHAPEEIWQATLEAVRAVVKRVDVGELSAVGITNQRETVLLWDRETPGSPRRAIVGRTAVRPTSARGCATRATRSGSPSSPGCGWNPYFSATKLRWLVENEPR